jgi:hypothetical protein
MAKFKKLTLGRMPRVFVAILAHDEADMIVETIIKALPRAVRDKVLPASNPALFFHGILDLPKDERRKLVPVIDDALEDLASQDFFGTEGQLDPRGDPRG